MKLLSSPLRTGLFVLLAVSSLISPALADARINALVPRGDDLQVEDLAMLHEQLEKQRDNRSSYYSGLTAFQDSLLRLLRDSSGKESFGQHMDQLSPVNERFFQSAEHCYQLVYPKVNPQFIEDPETGHTLFLNTYKTGRLLSSRERAYFFDVESSSFKRDKQADIFHLDHEELGQLQPEVTYNFVLLPDNSVYASLEKPTTQPYQAGANAGKDEPFAYPNHSILAGVHGDPEQAVLTAGALILHRVGDKELWFLSNKSGHFLPTIESLDFMRFWLVDQGVDPATIVPVMELNYAKHCFLRPEVRLDISLMDGQAERMARHAFWLWSTNYRPERLERIALQLVEQPEKGLADQELIRELNTERQHAFRLRAALTLLDSKHRAPKALRSYTKWLGKMKDGLELGRSKDVQKGAQKLLPWLKKLEPQLLLANYEAATPEDVEAHVRQLTEQMQQRRLEWLLKEDDFHQLKKDVRTLGFYFWLLAEDEDATQIQMNREVFRRLTNINVQMGEVMDRLVEQSEPEATGARVQRMVRLGNTVKRRLGRILNKIDKEAA